MGLFKINTKKLKGKTLHVIDANAVAGTKFYSFKDFSWNVDGNQVFTGAIYAIIGILKDIPLNENNKIIFCFDSAGNQRKEENSDYKSGRVGFGNDYVKQLETAKSMLIMCGFDTYAQTGYEADDFVVGAVNNFKDMYDNVIVYTNDDDMTQVIDDKVQIRMIHTKRNDVTRENYDEVVKVPYNTILLQKSLVGCSSDKVKGIPGFGDKKFINMLNECVVGKYNLEDIRKNNLEEEIIDYIFENSKELEKLAAKELKKRLKELNEQAEKEASFEEMERISQINPEKAKQILLMEFKEQALESLKLVKGRIPADFNFEDNKVNINYTTLANICDKYGMKSIVKYLIDQKVVHSII